MTQYVFPARLKRERLKRGLTQQSLAKKIGLSQQAVASWETGAKIPTIDRVIDVARALKIRPSMLIDEDIKI